MNAQHTPVRKQYFEIINSDGSAIWLEPSQIDWYLRSTGKDEVTAIRHLMTESEYEAIYADMECAA